MDVDKAVSVFSALDQSITSHSIKDMFRLGRFSTERKQPRPLLVKFIRAADASKILSKRGLVRRPVLIKPDMYPEEREKESTLLRERWSLIQSGVPRETIKIRDCRLYVKNKLHGQVTKSGFQLSSCLDTSPADVNNSIVPTVSINSVTMPKSPESQSDTSSTELNVSGVSSHTQGQSQLQPPVHTPASDSQQ